MNGRVLGVVPARLGSSRLPRKPLHPILGRPLIEWVWRRVRTVDVLDLAVVATDSTEVADVCRAFGAPVEMTDPGHESGTDRVAEVVRRKRYRTFEYVANIQGDEPLLDADHVKTAVELVGRSGWDVGTCAAPIGTADAFADPSVVKVVRASDGRAIYFSRAPVPHRRDGPAPPDELGGGSFLRHVGLYTYTRDALERWVALPPSPLERIERLEQLRALEAGLGIGVALVASAEGGVDTPDDVARVEARLGSEASITFA